VSNSRVRISPGQLLAILACLTYGKSIGYTNGVLARNVAQDAWIAISLAFLSGLVLLWAVVWLARRFADQTPATYIPRLLGRPLGSLVMLLLALFFLGSFITSAVTIEQHINDYLLTETPLVVFVIGYTLLTVYGVYLGIEVAGRLAALGLTCAALLNFSMGIGAMDKLDVTRLLPVLDHPLPRIMGATLQAQHDVLMAVVGALLLFPLARKPERWLRSGAWALGLGAVLILTWTIFEIGVLSPEVTAQYLISCMQMARASELSIYLHRYELVMVILFVYSVITQSVVCLFGACELTAAALPWRVPRGWMVLGLGILSMVPQYYLAYDRDRYRAFLAIPLPWAALALGMGVPLLLCLVALFRRKLTGVSRT